MSTTKMTGGATAGTTPSTTTKKSLWWIILAIVGIITFLWITSSLKGKGPDIVKFLTESSDDIIEDPSTGEFHRRGVKPQKIERTATGATAAAQPGLPKVANVYPIGATFKLTMEWQGVECFDNTKIISADYTSHNTYIQHRADMRDETINDLPPSNWTIRTNIPLATGNIAQWRIRPDQVNGTGTVTTKLKNKPVKAVTNTPPK